MAPGLVSSIAFLALPIVLVLLAVFALDGVGQVLTVAVAATLFVIGGLFTSTVEERPA